jgi:hypothetical protein
MNKIKALKQVHLSRLSPVMWTVQTGYPRPEISVPISSVNGGGMGSENDDGRYVATPMNPKASPLWSNTYRIGAAGALSRVAPYGPSAFGTAEEGSKLSDLWPFFVALGGVALFTYFGSRRPW